MQEFSNHLKAISETADELRVANYIVLYGGRDLEGIASSAKNADGSVGNYFTQETIFESPYTRTGKIYVDWEHGLESKHDADAPGKDDVLGYVDWTTAKTDSVGLWVERVLDRRNRYLKYLEMLIKEGLIGNSTETIQGKARIEPDGKITEWPLKRDTLTVNPMEPRMMTQNALHALKSLAEEYPSLKALIPQGAGDAPVGAMAEMTEADNPTFRKHVEVHTMSDVTLTNEEYKELLRGQIKAADVEPVKPDLPEDPAIKAINERLSHLTEIIEKSPVLKDAGYVAPDSEDDDAEVKSFGDFLVAVKNRNAVRLHKVYQSTQDTEDAGDRKSRKTALAESAGATGGYIVPTQYVQPIMAAAAPLSVLRRAGATVVPMTGRTAQVPALDVETAPSAGDTAFAAGVVAYWEGEADTLSESEPRFRLIELVAHKLAGYSLASNEMRNDAAASVEALLTTMFGRAVGSKENYGFFRGDGVGKPYGILNSSALIAATRSAASAVALDDLGEMMSNFLPSSWGNGAWFINPDVVQKLIGLVSAPLAYMNADLANARVPMNLLGMPVFITGALPALNTAGDILLVDPSYYLIGDRQQMSIAYSEHYAFVTDQGAWRFTHRVDGQPWLNTYITLENASTTVSPFCSLAAG